MSDFLEKSKDLHFSGDPKYKHFKNVFVTIADMHKAKSYYNTDLHNIEEILSILEMQQTLSGERKKRQFLRYITDVIHHFTPPVAPQDNTEWPEDWVGSLFSQKRWLPGYGYFVACLFNATFTMTHLRQMHGYTSGPVVFEESVGEVSYAVVTLNYDIVLESICQYMNSTFNTKVGLTSFNSPEIRFRRAGDEYAEGGCNLSKLHGSVDSPAIIPPTWNKTLSRDIAQEWRIAYGALKDANHIRILGYSLPVADSYVKYLLKSAVIETQNLKSLDIICRDSDGAVKRRYAEFIDYPKWRFIEDDIEKYLERIGDFAARGALATSSTTPSGHQLRSKAFNGVLEKAHADFFEEPRIQPVFER